MSPDGAGVTLERPDGRHDRKEITMFLLILGILLMALGSSGLDFWKRHLRRHGMLNNDRTSAGQAVLHWRFASGAIFVASLASIGAGLATTFT